MCSVHFIAAIEQRTIALLPGKGLVALVHVWEIYFVLVRVCKFLVNNIGAKWYNHDG